MLAARADGFTSRDFKNTWCCDLSLDKSTVAQVALQSYRQVQADGQTNSEAFKVVRSSQTVSERVYDFGVNHVWQGAGVRGIERSCDVKEALDIRERLKNMLTYV